MIEMHALRKYECDNLNIIKMYDRNACFA